MEREAIMRAKLVLALFLVGTLWGSSLAAQGPAVEPQSGSWSETKGYQKLYRSGSPARVRGNVLSTEDLRLEGSEPGMQLKLRTETGDLWVHLGPRWFMTSHDELLTHGEPITVIGVQIHFDGHPAVIANEIQKGESRLILREPATGRPEWGAPPHK
jgi:hypothetical protein